MSILTGVVTLPAYWASAVVNGDFSGVADPDEKRRIHKRVDELAKEGWSIVDVARYEDGNVIEPRFTWSYEFYDNDGNCSGGEVEDYIMHKTIKDV